MKNSSSQHDDEHNHGGHHHHGQPTFLKDFLLPALSFIIFSAALYLDHFSDWKSTQGNFRLYVYILAYLPVGFPVLKEAFESILHKNVFSEFLLMSIATLGAFAIGEYPEAVAVMLFYAVGETFQSMAVSRAKANIALLLDQRPEVVTIIKDQSAFQLPAEKVQVGDIIQLKPGEKLALDGVLLSSSANFNAAALTGESLPLEKKEGEEVLAGMIHLNGVSLIKVSTAFQDSKLSKILELVQNAASKKAPTELFIRKFAKIYTPIVVVLAAAICFLPWFFIADYQFHQWLYKALVFLVISCPCALVISVPLGYFGGIGAGSRNGILFKGGNFLDVMAKVQHIVVDKTGTITEGIFRVKEVVIAEGFSMNEILPLVNQLENYSSHPIASAIKNYCGQLSENILLTEVEEIPGHGLKAIYQQKLLLAGNFQLLQKFGISFESSLRNIPSTVLAIAFDGKFAGYFLVEDTIKPDAQKCIRQLNDMQIKVTMLSGDKKSVVQQVAQSVGIQSYFGELLPEGKVQKLKEFKAENAVVAFAGDGINDAPVIALSDAGIAMGGLGSDVAIESADIVIQDDKPSKIPLAISIGRETRKIVWQNIFLAFVVKAIVLLLGAGGIATMWEAVFADVGVALLAILNALRIQQMKFSL